MNNQEALELVTPEALRSWIESEPEGSHIGLEHHVEMCPLAEFYQEKYGAKVFVGTQWSSDTLRVAGEASAVKLPQWASDFVHWIDEGEASEEVEDGMYRPTRERLLVLIDDLMRPKEESDNAE